MVAAAAAPAAHVRLGPLPLTLRAAAEQTLKRGRIAAWRLLELHLQQLEVRPREAAEELARRDPAEERRVRVRRQGARVLSEEGHRAGAVTHEDAVLLRGVSERGYRRRKPECIDVERRVEPEMRALGDR